MYLGKAFNEETWKVLIVAKCIVNQPFLVIFLNFFLVLIVAKCIVNRDFDFMEATAEIVLIVAKCIVNMK